MNVNNSALKNCVSSLVSISLALKYEDPFSQFKKFSNQKKLVTINNEEKMVKINWNNFVITMKRPFYSNAISKLKFTYEDFYNFLKDVLIDMSSDPCQNPHKKYEDFMSMKENYGTKWCIDAIGRMSELFLNLDFRKKGIVEDFTVHNYINGKPVNYGSKVFFKNDGNKRRLIWGEFECKWKGQFHGYPNEDQTLANKSLSWVEKIVLLSKCLDDFYIKSCQK